ncbi:1450_t:CDS:1, partial [Cetraspora pellucida]
KETLWDNIRTSGLINRVQVNLINLENQYIFNDNEESSIEDSKSESESEILKYRKTLNE